MARRPVAVVTAIVLVLEAFGVAALNGFLGLVVDRQHMSLGGLDPHLMSVSTWVLGVVVGLFLLLCAVGLVRAAVRNRDVTGFFRVLLVVAAVVHGVLGAVVVGLVGWLAFGFVMVVMALIVLSLVALDEHGDERPWRPGWLAWPPRWRSDAPRT